MGRRARPRKGTLRPGGSGDARDARARPLLPPGPSAPGRGGAGSRAGVGPSSAAAAWSPRCENPQPRCHSSWPWRAFPTGAPEPPSRAAPVSALAGSAAPLRDGDAPGKPSSYRSSYPILR